MKQSNHAISYYALRSVLSCAALTTVLCAAPSISFAAKAAPSSGVGGLPHQAPLQPLPQGVGANFSNNIQQTENSGPPDSAGAVPPADAGVAADQAEDALDQNTSAGSNTGHSSSRTGRIVLWLVAIACLAGFLGWLWFVVNRHASK